MVKFGHRNSYAGGAYSGCDKDDSGLDRAQTAAARRRVLSLAASLSVGMTENWWRVLVWHNDPCECPWRAFGAARPSCPDWFRSNVFIIVSSRGAYCAADTWYRYFVKTYIYDHRRPQRCIPVDFASSYDFLRLSLSDLFRGGRGFVVLLAEAFSAFLVPFCLAFVCFVHVNPFLPVDCVYVMLWLPATQRITRDHGIRLRRGACGQTLG